MTHMIVRRAFSKYEHVASVTAGWLAAMTLADEMQFANKDGEYLVRGAAEGLAPAPSGYVQSGFDYL